MKRILILLLALALVFSCVACDIGSFIEVVTSEPEDVSFEPVSIITDVSLPEESCIAEESSLPEESEVTEESEEEPGITVDKDGAYYDLEHVVAYLATYKKLPSNYITKAEAQKLGWSGGTVERYKNGAAIGGDYYGNYEKRLPTTKGIKYTECDLDTVGSKPRGEKRLIYSTDWHFYYTEDHYETFREVVYEDGKVVFK